MALDVVVLESRKDVQILFEILDVPIAFVHLIAHVTKRRIELLDCLGINKE